MGLKFVSHRIDHYIKDKWHGRPCPMCQTGSWSVSDRVYELREFNNGHLIIGGGPVIPVISVVCDECGNTMFIDAYHTGMMDT